MFKDSKDSRVRRVSIDLIDSDDGEGMFFLNEDEDILFHVKK